MARKILLRTDSILERYRSQMGKTVVTSDNSPRAWRETSPNNDSTMTIIVMVARVVLVVFHMPEMTTAMTTTRVGLVRAPMEVTHPRKNRRPSGPARHTQTATPHPLRVGRAQPDAHTNTRPKSLRASGAARHTFKHMHKAALVGSSPTRIPTHIHKVACIALRPTRVHTHTHTTSSEFACRV